MPTLKAPRRDRINKDAPVTHVPGPGCYPCTLLHSGLFDHDGRNTHYRLKEAKERAETKSATRAKKRA